MQMSKIDNINDILDRKITEISQMRKMLTKQLFEIETATNLKNKILKYLSNHKYELKSLKYTFNQIVEIISIVQKNYKENLQAIISMDEIYQSQINHINHKFYRQTKYLQSELQTQYKIVKILKQEIQKLKMNISCHQKQKQVSQNITPQTSVVKSCNSVILETIKQQDQLIHSNRQATNNKTNNNGKLFLTLQNLQSKLKVTETINTQPPELVLDEYRKSFIKTLNYNNNQNYNQQIQQSMPPYQFQQQQQQQQRMNQLTSQLSTPTKNLLIISNLKQRKFFSEMNSQDQCQKIYVKSIQKQCHTNKKRYQHQKQNSYLITHLKKKKIDPSNTKFLARFKSNSLTQSKEKLRHQDKYKQIIKNINNIKQKTLKFISENKNNYILYVGDKKTEVKYQGQKKDGKKCGKGILYYSTGLIYEGDFKDNMRYGTGILRFNHIQIYSGQWANNMIHGNGKIKNCSIINKKNRIKDEYMDKWITYVGEFQENRFHGLGTLIFQNGDMYNGNFKNGFVEDQGKLYNINTETKKSDQKHIFDGQQEQENDNLF